MNENKIKFLKENVGFHLSDLSYGRQLEFKGRPESFEWKLLALSRDKLANWEKYGFRYFDNPEFRQNIDNSLAVLELEEDKKFAAAMRNERKRTGIWVDEEVARRKYERMKKYWKYFGQKDPFIAEDGKEWRFNFTSGVTEYGKQRLYQVMAYQSFDDLTEDEWFVLWTAYFAQIIHIQLPQRKEGK